MVVAAATARVWAALDPRFLRARRHLLALEYHLAQKSPERAYAAYGELCSLVKQYPRKPRPLQARLLGACRLHYYWHSREQRNDPRRRPVPLDAGEAALAAQIFEEALALAQDPTPRDLTILLTARVLAAVMSVSVKLGDLRRANQAFRALVGLKDHCPRCFEVVVRASEMDGKGLGPPIT